ncbi:MAG: mannitol dehydrogenase family protein, partial [Geminicoccaceae bacterium]
MDRLSEATRQRLPSTVRLPAYRRRELSCGIVHLGVGAFHRAHQAVYTELALAQAFGPWGICGVSLRRP